MRAAAAGGDVGRVGHRASTHDTAPRPDPLRTPNIWGSSRGSNATISGQTSANRNGRQRTSGTGKSFCCLWKSDLCEPQRTLANGRSEPVGGSIPLGSTSTPPFNRPAIPLVLAVRSRSAPPLPILVGARGCSAFRVSSRGAGGATGRAGATSSRARDRCRKHPRELRTRGPGLRIRPGYPSQRLVAALREKLHDWLG